MKEMCEQGGKCKEDKRGTGQTGKREQGENLLFEGPSRRDLLCGVCLRREDCALELLEARARVCELPALLIDLQGRGQLWPAAMTKRGPESVKTWKEAFLADCRVWPRGGRNCPPMRTENATPTPGYRPRSPCWNPGW